MDQSASVAPLQKEELQQGIDANNTAASENQDQYQFQKGQQQKLAGVQGSMLNEAATYNTTAKQNQLAGEAEGDVTQAFTNSDAQNTRSLNREGVDPGSGRALAIKNENSVAQATSLAGAGNSARQQAVNTGFALEDRAAGSLSGTTQATQGAIAEGASIGAGGIADANAGLAGLNSGYGLASGSAGSLGSNASGMYGTQANAYQSSQNAEAQSDAALGTAVGGIAIAAI